MDGPINVGDVYTHRTTKRPPHSFSRCLLRFSLSTFSRKTFSSVGSLPCCRIHIGVWLTMSVSHVYETMRNENEWNKVNEKNILSNCPDRHSTCGYTDMRENAETSCHWLWISRHRWQQQRTNERVFRKRMLCVLCIDVGMRKSMYSNRPWSANWMWCEVGWFVGDALSVSLRRS